MGAAAAEADRTLFVGNLETKVTEELLFELFHQVSGREAALPFVYPALLWLGPTARPAFFSKAGLRVPAPEGWAAWGRRSLWESDALAGGRFMERALVSSR